MNAQLNTATPETVPVAELCNYWLHAKHEESTAKAKRIALENMLIQQLGFSKPDGQSTFKDSGYKIEIKSGFNYRLDLEKWEEISHLIPDGLRPVKIKWEVDERGAKYLRNNEPKLWKIIAKAITVTPAKPSIKVESLVLVPESK